MDAFRVGQNVLRVGGLGDRPAVAEQNHVVTHGSGRIANGANYTRAVLEFPGRFGADVAAGGQPHVGNDDVRPGASHRLGFGGDERVGRGQQILLPGEADHFDFLVEAHARLFEIDAKRSVDQADGGKVLHAGKADRLDLIEKDVHQAKRIRPTDPGKHRRFADDGQDFLRHLHDDAVRIPVGHHPRKRPATRHPKPTRVVDDNEIDAAGLLTLGRQTRTRPAADNRCTGGNLFAKPAQNGCSRLGHRSFLFLGAVHLGGPKPPPK